MRAPNQQGCGLDPKNKPLSVSNVGDIIRHCVQYFEEAAAGEYGIEFRVTEDDCAALLALYPDFQDTNLRLIALINEALAARQMPYRLGDLTEHYGVAFLYTVHRHAEAA